VESEERIIGAEQETKQWKSEVEELRAELVSAKQEGEWNAESLLEQLAVKANLVEQLKKTGSE